MQTITLTIDLNTQEAQAAVASFQKEITELGGQTKKVVQESNNLDKSLEQQEIRLKRLDGVINIVGGSIETLVGGLAASGLVSEENAEQFEAAALGAIAFADGTKRVFDGVKSLTEAQKLATAATNSAEASQKALNLQVLKNPYVLAAAALAALVAGIVAYKVANDEAGQAQSRINDLNNKALDLIGDQITDLRVLQNIVNDTTIAEEKRETALKKLAELIPELKGLDLDRKDVLEDINDAIAREIKLITQRARVAAAEESLTDNLKEQLRLEQEIERLSAGRLTAGEKVAFRTYLSLQGTIAKYKNELKEAREEEEFFTRFIVENTSPALEGLGKDLEKNVVDPAKAAQEALNKLNAAIQVQTEAELSLLSEKDREIKEREMRFQKDIETLKAAGFTDFKALEEEYRIDLAAINKKYDDATQAALDAENAITKQKLTERANLINEIDTALAITDQEKKDLAIQQTTIYYNKLIEEAKKEGIETVRLEEAKQKALTKLAQEGVDDRTKLEKFFESELAKSIGGTLQTAAQFASTLANVQDESTKEGFEKAKKYKIAEVVTSAIQSSFQAFGAAQQFGPVLGPILGAAQVAAIAIASRKAIQDIQSSQFGGTSVPSGGGGGAASTGARTAVAGGMGAGAGLFGAPTPPLPPTLPTPTGGGATAVPVATDQPTVVRAYVLSGDVTSAQQASANINRRRSLTGG